VAILTRLILNKFWGLRQVVALTEGLINDYLVPSFRCVIYARTTSLLESSDVVIEKSADKKKKRF
jgi:hypothetical protein